MFFWQDRMVGIYREEELQEAGEGASASRLSTVEEEKADQVSLSETFYARKFWPVAK